MIIASEDILHLCISLAHIHLVLLDILLKLRIDEMTRSLNAYILLRAWYVIFTQLRSHALRSVYCQPALLQVLTIATIVNV